MMIPKNAIIRSVNLGIEDHGLMTAFVNLDFGSAQQGFGGFCLDEQPETEDGNRVPSRGLGLFVARVLEVSGVTQWEKLPGTSVRTLGDWERIDAIGHYLKDEWFWPKKEFEVLYSKYPGTK